MASYPDSKWSAPLQVALEEALCVFEAFRRLGFPSDIIFLVLQDGGAFGIGLHAQGIRYLVPCGQVPESDEDIRRAWLVIAERWDDRNVSNEWREALWAKSFVANHRAEFVGSMIRAGFKLTDGHVPAGSTVQ